MAEVRVLAGNADGVAVAASAHGYCTPVTGNLHLPSDSNSGTITFRSAGTISRLSARVISGNRSATTPLVDIYINGNPGNSQILLAPGGTPVSAGEYTDDVNTETVSAGDTVSIHVFGGSSGNANWTFGSLGFIFTASTGTVTRFGATGSLAYSTASETSYRQLAANASKTTTQANGEWQVKIPSGYGAITLRNLYVRVSGNTRTTNTTVAINGATGSGTAPNVTIAGSSGATTQEDQTNSIVANDGDKLSYKVVTSTGTGTLTIQEITIEVYTTDGLSFFVVGSPAGEALGTNNTRIPIGGGLEHNATESRSQNSLGLIRKLSHLESYWSDGTTGTITLHDDTANAGTPSTMSNASSDNAWVLDSSNTFTTSETDQLNYNYARTATATVHCIAMSVTLPIQQKFAQTQADIKQTYSVHSQAQADIKQVYQQYAQAQALIVMRGYGHGQAQADIKAIGRSYAQAQADIKQTYPLYITYAYDTFTEAGTGTANLNTHTAEVGGTWSLLLNFENTPILIDKDNDRAIGVFDTAPDDIHYRLGTWDSQDTYIYFTKPTDSSSEVGVMARIADSGNFIFAYLIDDGVTPPDPSFRWRVYQLVDSTYTPLFNTGGFGGESGAAQRARVEVIGTTSPTIRGRVWTVGASEPTGWDFSVTATARGLGGAGIYLGTNEGEVSFLDDLNVFYEAGATFAQARAWIKAVSFGHAQAQADIKARVSGHGQARASIKQTYPYGPSHEIARDTFTEGGTGTADLSTHTAELGGTWTDWAGTGTIKIDKDSDESLTNSSTTPVEFGDNVYRLGTNTLAEGSLYITIRAPVDLSSPLGGLGFRLNDAGTDGFYLEIESTGFSDEPSWQGFVGHFIGTYHGTHFFDSDIEDNGPLNLVGGFGDVDQRLRVAFSGTPPNTRISVKIWNASESEPENWSWSFVTTKGNATGGFGIYSSYEDLFGVDETRLDDFIASYQIGEANLSRPFGQAQALIIAASNVFAQAQADIKQTYFVHSQAQADIKQVYQSYAQTQADIKQTYQAYAQCQADIKQTYFAHSQAQADILQTYFGPAQAQADVKQIYYSHAQCQANIKQTYQGYAQAQADILQIYQEYGQAQADIRQTYTGHAQAQADIKQTYYGFSQSQADILQIYYGHGQSQAIIRAVDYGFGQANCDIKQTYYVHSQAQANVKATYSEHGQCQADIKQTYYSHGQAQAEIDAGAGVVTRQGYAQAQADIKAVYQSFGQAQASILTTYYRHAQAQSDIKQIYPVYAQSQADIKSVEQSYAQSQAGIKTTYYNQGQSNADIKALTNKSGNAQADIKATINSCGQSQAYIQTRNFVHAQTTADIKNKYAVSAQTQAYIQLAGITQFGQCQALILKSAGYGQAQAFIDQKHKLKKVNLSDTGSTESSVSDRSRISLGVSDRSIGLVSNDRQLNLSISDKRGLKVTISDKQF